VWYQLFSQLHQLRKTDEKHCAKTVGRFWLIHTNLVATLRRNQQMQKTDVCVALFSHIKLVYKFFVKCWIPACWTVKSWWQAAQNLYHGKNCGKMSKLHSTRSQFSGGGEVGTSYFLVRLLVWCKRLRDCEGTVPTLAWTDVAWYLLFFALHNVTYLNWTLGVCIALLCVSAPRLCRLWLCMSVATQMHNELTIGFLIYMYSVTHFR